MIDVKVEVTFTDGTSNTFSVTPKVQVEFERTHKIGISRAFTDDVHVEYIYWLGWCAAKYSGTNPKPFDSWLDGVARVNVVDESSAPLDVTP
jgi:hypothetical protein